MAQLNNKELTTLPVGRLGLIPLDSCRPLGEKVNEWLVKWRKERENPELGTCAFEGYQRDSYIINVNLSVSRNKSANRRIIVSALEIIEPCLAVVVVSAISYRIYYADVV